jgi:hypothetical protein
MSKKTQEEAMEYTRTGMQLESSVDSHVDSTTLSTLAAILRQAETSAGTRVDEGSMVGLAELIAASKTVFANAGPLEEVNRFVCYRLLLKLAAGKESELFFSILPVSLRLCSLRRNDLSADSNPNWWDKLARLGTASDAGAQDEDELASDELESSLVAAVSFWAHGHMRSCFRAWWEWTAEASTHTFKLHTIVRCAARVLPTRILLLWRGRLSVYCGEGNEQARQSLLRVFDRIWRVRFLHAWAKVRRQLLRLTSFPRLGSMASVSTVSLLFRL